MAGERAEDAERIALRVGEDHPGDLALTCWQRSPRRQSTSAALWLALSQVRQLANGPLQAPGLDGIGRRELKEQPRCRHPKGATELLWGKASDQRVLEVAGDRDGQGVGPLRVVSWLSQRRQARASVWSRMPLI